MSYRTNINREQVFGNNEYYPEWIEFIKSKGIEVNEDGCYEGKIDDVMGMFEVIDKITKKLIDERHKKVLNGEKDFHGRPLKEMTDLSDSVYLDNETPILMFNEQKIKNAYCFLPYQVYLAVEDKIERVYGKYEKAGVDWSFCNYKLKDGETITVSAG